MILGATGSVGSSAVQIAQSMGHKTITVGRHGTDVNSVEDPELQKAKELTGGNGPNVVIDTVGDLALTKAAFDVLANSGRLSTIAAPKQGSTELSVDLRSLYRRQVEVIGVNTTSFTQEELAKLMKELAVSFESGKLAVPDESTMTELSIDQAGDAYSGKAKRAVIVFDE
jgi:NADPH:quinone reductase